MRTSLSPITTLVAAFFTIAALSCTGCQSPFKMPSTPSWLSLWNKKKPSTSLAQRPPDTKLPSPSATATPSQPQSYAQNRNAGSSYGARPGSSYYSGTGYGNPSTNPSYAAGGASSDRGFYSPDYAKGGAQQSVSGGYSAPPASYASDPARSGSGSRYGSYGPNGFAPSAGAAAAGQPRASGQTTQPGASPRSTAGDYGYGRTATRSSASNYGTNGAPATAGNYRADTPSYGGAPSNYSTPKSAPAYSGGFASGTGSAPPTSAPPVASGDYRPGSTSRSTPYGDSQSINVAGLRGIQPASYGADNTGRGADSVTDGSQAPPAAYGPQGSRTATGQQYPTTNSSIYR